MLPTPALPTHVAATLDAVRALGAAARDGDASPTAAPPTAARRTTVDPPGTVEPRTTVYSRPVAPQPISLTPVTAPRSADERAAWLVGLRRIVDAAEAAFTTVLADFDSAGDGETLHAAASTQAWLRGALGMASGEASERVRMARSIRAELGDVVSALNGPPGLPSTDGSSSDGGDHETTASLWSANQNDETDDQPPGLVDPHAPNGSADTSFLVAANGVLRFIGPAQQHLESPVPSARGPSP